MSFQPARSVRGAILAVLLCGAWSAALPDAASLPDPGRASIRIEPTRTRVALARVHLKLGELRPDGNDLVGNFEINVPMLPLSDDRGTVRIHVPGSFPELARRGVVLDGTARSESGQVNPVRCRVSPDGSVTISITTPRRTLSFDSRYRLVSDGA